MQAKCRAVLTRLFSTAQNYHYLKLLRELINSSFQNLLCNLINSKIKISQQNSKSNFKLQPILIKMCNSLHTAKHIFQDHDHISIDIQI